MDVHDLYSAGQLGEAVTAAFTVVKGKPADVGARLFLAELLCFQGDWERAEKQLDTAAKQSQDDGFFALLIRQLIRGEILREQVFTEGRPPQLVGELPPDAKMQLEICTELRNQQDTSQLVEAAQKARQAIAGKCNDQHFEDIRDLDDRMAGILEVITATGKYYWVPWKSVRTLELSKPERPADLIWRKASIDVENGPEGDVFIPVRYPCPNAAGWDDQLRLGRATTWVGEGAGAVIGLGQKMILVGDETKSSLEIDNLAIAPL